MDTVFVSGKLNAPAQIKMGDRGYLLTFDMTHSEEGHDASGKLKNTLTKWSVVLQYDEEPTAISEKLGQGMKVLVKGNANINHKIIDENYVLDCSLEGLSLNVLEEKAVAELNTSNEIREAGSKKAMAS